ncbi:MAG: 6-phosphogluconolactonase [Bacteroidetes bacterium]|nr:6-phosphogluconolactonase [Bacteroidota bacterium]
MKPEIKIFSGPKEVAQQFAIFLADFVLTREKITIALSGGSTPKLLFDHLASHYSKSMDWAKMHFFWGDERCLPPDHSESNYKMTSDHLLSKIEIPDENIHRIKGEMEPQSEADRYAAEINDHLVDENNLPRFDLIILGMGEDGHTASIFPHQMHLLKSENIYEVSTHPESGQKRITLTGKVINNAAQVVFLVTGKSKAEKMFEILEQQGRWKDYPATYIQPHNGNLIWFLDRTAAGKLDNFF